MSAERVPGCSQRRQLRRYSVRRETFTESKLSVKASVRGKGPSPERNPTLGEDLESGSGSFLDNAVINCYV
jgi:hypothetical protein